MPVTLRDIANAAGVDSSVVSAVLNGSTRIRVSAERRKQILALIESMNYRVNIAARSLITRRNYSIGVLLCSTRDRFYAEMIGEIQGQLAARGYTGIFGFWSDSGEIAGAYESVLNRGVDGVITCHNDLSRLPSDLPVLIYGEEASGVDCLIPDWEYLMRNSMRYLYQLGHRKIGYIGYQPGEVRSLIYRRLLDEFALSWNADWVSEGSGFAGDALAGAHRVMVCPNPPTALMTRNDTVAIASICAAAAIGIRVPEQLSVIGIDNIEESGYSNPPLTTSGVSMKLLVSQMLDRLFARLEKPDLHAEKIIFQPELIIRKSCGEVQ